MSGRILLAGLVFVIAAATINGQTKTSGTMQCQKPDPLYSLEVQDHPGHVMLLQKAICSYTTSNEIGGDKAKDSYGVSMADATATHAVASGTHVVSYESGDKAEQESLKESKAKAPTRPPLIQTAPQQSNSKVSTS